MSQRSGGWEVIGWIAVDAAAAAFGAASAIGEDFPLHFDRSHGDGSPPGYEGSLVLQSTMEDCSLPVEVRCDEVGVVDAARMCFTTDVDELHGDWRVIGALDLPDGLCVACDPYCHDPLYRFQFKVMPGSYVAEVFDFTYPDAHTDVLGLRLRLDRTAIGGAG